MDATRQVKNLLKTGFLQHMASRAGAIAAGANNDDRLFLELVDFGKVFGQMPERNMTGIGNVPGRPLGGFTHINHERILAIDQQGSFIDRDIVAALTAESLPEQHAAADRSEADPHQVLLDEFHEHGVSFSLWMRLAGDATEYFAHHHNQLQGTPIRNPVKNTIGILARGQYALFAQNGEMLGNIALRRADRINDILHANFLIPHHTQDFQAQWMRNRLQCAGGDFDLLLMIHHFADRAIHGSRLFSNNFRFYKMRPLLLAIALAFLVPPGIAIAVGEKEKARLDTLREQRAALEKKLEESEQSRTESANRLRETEQAISVVGRKLRELGDARAAAQKELGAHERELTRLERQQQARLAQLARLLRHQFRNREADALGVLLAGGDPNVAARDRHFLALLSQAKAELITGLRHDAGQIRQVSEAVRARGDKLTELARHEEAERAQLRQRQQERQIVLSKIAAQIKSTQREIETLRQNEQRLAQLIDSLAKRAAQSKPRTKPAPSPRTTGKAPAAEPVNAGGDFAKLRGKLLRPIDGIVAARFGSKRDDGQSTWKGLFFRAGEGASVRAVAAGVVVFADWLRGYGNLIIIDHDDDFLSVYGNNQTLLADVGQKVGAGATVGTAGTGIGAGGGAVESGLYFELRHRGQAFDPGKWLK